MTNRGQHTYQEIMSQPQVWADAIQSFEDSKADLQTLWETGAFQQVIFTGCGSTHYLSLMAASLFQQMTHQTARAFPASELVLYSEPSEIPTLLIAISRSGETTETLDAVDIFRKNNVGKIVSVTCYSDSRLAAKADLTISIDSAGEESVAQTRSFSSMAVVAQLIAAFLSGQGTQGVDALSSACQQILDEQQSLAKQLGEDSTINRFFFLGAHRLYGIAAEAMLKMKEMSLSYSEAYHTLEFRHGPMSMVDEHSLVIGLLTEEGHIHEIAVLQEMQNRGARILAIGAEAVNFELKVTIPDSLPVWCRPILYLPTLQLIAYYRALFNQQNPDKPQNLTAVVSLDSLQDKKSEDETNP